MSKALLKSKHGCRKCRQRRRKCDEVKPVCGECSRLGFPHCWTTPDQSLIKIVGNDRAQTKTLVVHSASNEHSPRQSLPDETQDVVQLMTGFACAFDSPSILRTDAVPNNGDADCKHVLQYLAEKGTSLLSFPVPVKRLPRNHEFNHFVEGYPLAFYSPSLLQAYLCVGANHLSKTHPSYTNVTLKYYNGVMSKLRQELTHCVERPPAEWACGVAALLSFYELVAFHSPRSRLAHLVGFHRLVEARMSHKLGWGPIKLLLEQYIYSMTIGALFHYQLLVGHKSIAYIDHLIDILNGPSRFTGPEIAGVPEDLISVMYRLVVLNFHDVSESPWDTELIVTSAKLIHWAPAPHALLPSGAGLLLVADLHRLACFCLLRNITDRTANGATEEISACLEKASLLISDHEVHKRPFNSLVWPLTIFSIFAIDVEQRSTFLGLITTIVDTSKVEGYRSILEFLSFIESEEIGHHALLRQDLLSMVHM